MGEFTAEEIRILLNRLKMETVVEKQANFPFEIVHRRIAGFSQDPQVAGIEAKLSIMLEAA